MLDAVCRGGALYRVRALRPAWGLVKGEHLGRQLTADDVQEGDDDESEDIRNRLRPDQCLRAFGNQAERALDRRADVRAISDPTKKALPTIRNRIRISFPSSTHSIFYALHVPFLFISRSY
jgi:hypothetical protein